MKVYNVYFFGDSHTRSFFGIEEQILYKDRFLFHNHYKSSVSLSGLLKIENEYRLQILHQIEIDPDAIFIFKFGQVDIEYVYYYKTFIQNKQIDFENYYSEMIDRYIDFILILPIKNKIICSTNLPNQNHSVSTILQHLNNYSLNISFQNVSNNTIIFNDLLQQKCLQKNILFLNILTLMIQKHQHENFYILKDHFIGKDHHISGCEWQPMLTYERKLNSYYGCLTVSILQNVLYDFLLSYSNI